LPKAEADQLLSRCEAIWTERKKSISYSPNYQSSVEKGQQIFRSKYIRGKEGVVLTPGHYTGVVTTETGQYIILPKYLQGLEIDDANRSLIQMFTYAYKLKIPYSDGLSSTTRLLSLFAEVLIHQFALLAIDVMKSHQYIAYQDVSENIGTIRGRINFKEHIRQNISKGRHDSIFCDYSVFQEDNLLNRIILFVSTRLSKITKVKENKKLLRELRAMLSDIRLINCSEADCNKVKLNYYQQSYSEVLFFCRLFLSNMSTSPFSDISDIRFFLINTNELFENFWAGYLSAILPEYQVDAKSSSFLARENLEKIFKIENDAILRNRGNGKAVIVDMKNKLLDMDSRETKYGISQNDLYQMASYAIRRNLSSVLLIHPSLPDGTVRKRTFMIDDELADKGIKVDVASFPMTKLGNMEYQDIVRGMVVSVLC
jgi:5-methylcytosine-specific restriction enzyme subunit McrC